MNVGSKNRSRGPAVPLAWFESYLAVLTHRNYDRAAAECDRTGNVVRDHVEKLQRWLALPLVSPTASPLELVTENAAIVATAAENVLRRFDQAVARIQGRAPNQRLCLRESKHSAVTLFQLQIFVELSKLGGPANAAYQVNCDVSTLHRQIRDLQELVGAKLFNGRQSRSMPQEGLIIAEAGKEISAWLGVLRFTATDRELKIARRQRLQRQIFVKLIEARSNVRHVNKLRRNRPETRGRTRSAKLRLSLLESGYARLSRSIGAIPREEAANLLLDSLIGSRPSTMSKQQALEEIASIYAAK